MTTIERLEKIVASPRLKKSNKDFIDSMLAQAKKKDLSENQLRYVEKYWDECFPAQEVLDKEKEWLDSFTDDMKADVKIMTEYYKRHYPSSNLAKNGDDPNWIPPKSIYDKAVASEWGKRIIKNYRSEFKFNVGEFYVLRDTARNRAGNRGLMATPLLVLDCFKDADNDFVNYYEVLDPSRMEDQLKYKIREDAMNFIKEKKKKNGDANI